MKWLLLLSAYFFLIPAKAAVILVGPDMPYSRPSEVAKIAEDGDVIQIEAGTYSGDVAVWRQNNLTIKGIGGLARIEAAGAAAKGKGIWVIQGSNTLIENIEFTGARVSSRNGAGIRQEGAGLTVRHCRFIDNQNGILASGNADSEILIENSEFIHNGAGDGQSHNMYIGHVKRFTLRGSYSARANVGHQVKSRADENFILFNRLGDEADGNASYIIDIPQGGRTYIIGNIIQQGPNAENGGLLSYAAENTKNPVQELTVVNNTFVNDRHAGTFIRNRSDTSSTRIINNIFAGKGKVPLGVGDLDNNLVERDPRFVNRGGFDYRLAEDSRARDAGKELSPERGIALTPEFEYKHVAGTVPRKKIGPIDIGAYEFVP